MSILDLTGCVFNRLTVLKEGTRKGVRRYWLCQCTCGTIHEFEQSNLRCGRSTSCGCYRLELSTTTAKDKFTIHGDHNKRLYNIHRGMLNRCNKQWDSNYPRYGGVGITVFEGWYDYLSFKEWALANGYTDDLTIDRKDSELNYCPDNCRWVTYQVQTRNRRKQNKPASSIFIGVSREKTGRKWLASLAINKITVRVGYFDNETAAAKARDQYIKDQGLQNFKMNFA